MTRLFNDPSNFSGDVLGGLCAAYPQYLQRVFGGAVRASASPQGQVSVVIGGGSGHFPAFSGWVGPGLAHGTVNGNVFASPSASQVYSVVKAADNGGGVLLSFGNYAGDVLHFGQAAERLRGEGIDVRIVGVSDDVASNTEDKPRERRGICGDLVVFKIAGAAAERGKSLDEVEELAWRANDRTRSLGIAFDGCTMPGANEPLFHVPAGEMSIGLGVHGEPGVREVPLGSAREVADLLVDGVVAEAPERDTNGYRGRAIVLLNGLGSVKYEELFIVYARVSERLADAGITPVLPEVGELMTSLDMAGLSLTLTFLDDELEELWTDPVDTISLRRGSITAREQRQVVGGEPARTEFTAGSPESQALSNKLAAALGVLHETMVAKESELARLDAIAGDGDHGQGMVYGTRGAVDAAEEALAAQAGASSLLAHAGAEWAEHAGGTSGALWGAALTAFGNVLGDDGAADDDVIVRAVRAGVDAVVRLGGAQLGDKTMVDALVPFAERLEKAVAEGTGLHDAWQQATQAAEQAASATADIVSRLGRSRVLGEKSLGTPDPGATSFAILMRSLLDAGIIQNR
jgi:L-erythrulose 1-kinase